MTEFVNLEAVAQKAMYQTRNILFDLRPVILEQQGLGPRLEQYVMRLRMVEPFRITLKRNAQSLVLTEGGGRDFLDCAGGGQQYQKTRGTQAPGNYRDRRSECPHDYGA